MWNVAVALRQTHKNQASNELNVECCCFPAIMPIGKEDNNAFTRG